MEFIQRFKDAARVSTPLVAIRTFDNQSTINAIRAIENKTKALVQWDAINGLTALNDAGENQINTLVSRVEAVQPATVDLKLSLYALSKLSLKDKDKETSAFLHNAHLFFEGGDRAAVIQGIWNLRDSFKAQGHMLVLLVSSGTILPSELSNDVLVLDEPLPTASDIENIIKSNFNDAGLKPPSNEVIKQATSALVGLPYFPADQSVAMCLTKNGLNLEELWEKKRTIINQTPGLEVWMGKDSLDQVGGLKSVKSFMKQLMEGKDSPRVILFIDEIEKATAGNGTDSSGVKTEMVGSILSWTEDKQMDGVIFLGLPGTSKSQLAKSVGGTYGVPVIKFDLAGMQDKHVGESGAKLRAAQATVDAIAGGKVLIIATCNNIQTLSPELKRRFSEGTFVFDVPNETEREAIWQYYLKVYQLGTQELPDSQGWTGAEIKNCAKKASRFGISLIEAAKYIIPVTKSNKETFDMLRRESDGKYLSASYEGEYKYNETSKKDFQEPKSGRKIQLEG